MVSTSVKITVRWSWRQRCLDSTEEQITTMCRWRHQAPLTVYENQNCDAAVLTHIRTEYSSCQGKETSRLWNLGFFFHSQSGSFDINLSLKLESGVWKTPPLFKDSAGAPDNAGISVSLFYLWFHGVLCIFLLFFFVFENGSTLCPGECSSGTDWGCTVKSLLGAAFHGEPVSSCPVVMPRRAWCGCL